MLGIEREKEGVDFVWKHTDARTLTHGSDRHDGERRRQ